MSWIKKDEVVTCQAIFGDETHITEIIAKNGDKEIVTGVDTALMWYQIYRTRKDYKNADRIKDVIFSWGFIPVFSGNDYRIIEKVWILRPNVSLV